MIIPQTEIEHLANRPLDIPVLATWVQQEWGHLTPNVTYEMRVSEFARMATIHTIPEAFVAVENITPVGMASLVEHDMLARMELSPWLAAVYVVPESRNRGVGSKLVRTAMQEARVLALDRLYLFTPDQIHFYRRLGWQALEQVSYRGERVTIMVYEAQLNPEGGFRND